MTRALTQVHQVLVVKVCPQCGAHYPGAAQFCPADGRTLHLDPQASDPLVGQTVGRFRLRRRLGTGGMGRVYLAEEVGSARLCAFKVIDAALADDGDAMQRFEREAANHATIKSHPHVAEMYDFGRAQDGTVYLAMEYIDGESLATLLDRTKCVPPARAVEIVRQVAEGLAAAHAVGVVHRDLKPDNIMIGRSWTGGDHVKLVDFGIAKRPRDLRQKVTRTGFSVGTPEYMSPEQIAADVLDARSDTYALGLVTFVMLAGALPFPTKTPDGVTMRMAGRLRTLRDVRPEVAWPPAVQAALDRALALSPDDRYPSVGEFGRDIVGAVAGWQQTATSATSTAPAAERVVLAPPPVAADAPPAVQTGARRTGGSRLAVVLRSMLGLRGGA